MAKHDTVAALSKAIVLLLSNAKPTFRHSPDNLAVELIDGKQFATGLTLEPGRMAVTVFLYRASVNNTMRVPPQRLGLDGKTYRAPLLLDLFYLITPWAASIDLQHSLLGWAMRVLHDAPVLPAALINDYAPTDPPLPAADCVELTFDSLGLQDLLAIWDKVKPNYQTSATYVARMVRIESESELTLAGPVQTREFKRELNQEVE